MPESRDPPSPPSLSALNAIVASMFGTTSLPGQLGSVSLVQDQALLVEGAQLEVLNKVIKSWYLEAQ